MRRHWGYLRWWWTMDDNVTVALFSYLIDAPYCDMFSTGSQLSSCHSRLATPLDPHWLLSAGVGSSCVASHLSVSLDRMHRRTACSQAPPCSILSFYTQANLATAMAESPHWHFSNSQGMPLSLATPPSPLRGQTSWAELRADWSVQSDKHTLTPAKQSGRNRGTRVTR